MDTWMNFAAYFGRLVLSGCALIGVLRWPLVRGKHILCATLALELAGIAASAIFFAVVRTQAPSSSVFQVYAALRTLSSLLTGVLMLAFASVMGAELRARRAREEDHDDP